MHSNYRSQYKIYSAVQSGGFTLIEVVLVLAIGGLLFLIAFIAFQQVSVNRRDTQRRNDMGRILAELQSASSDGLKITNQATLTAGSESNNGGFVGTYLQGPMQSPSGTYTFKYQIAPYYGTDSWTQSTALDRVQVTYNAKCGDTSNQLRREVGAYTVMLQLEKGVVCRDDQ